MKKREWKQAYYNAIDEAVGLQDALDETLDVTEALAEKVEIWHRRADQAKEIAYTLKDRFHISEADFVTIACQVILRSNLD